MKVVSYRDTGGKFYLDPQQNGMAPEGVPAFLDFVAQKGVGLNSRDWPAAATDEVAMLDAARLNWVVDHRLVLVPTAADGAVKVKGYGALVRPDLDKVMSVVTSAYRVAENRWVADTALLLGRQLDRTAALVGTASFGRSGERTMFVVRVRVSGSEALILLAHNSHGGEGAVRFRLVVADRWNGTVMAPDVPHATVSVPHVGDVKQRLGALLRRSLVAEYLSETEEMWRRLSDRLWSRRHTSALVRELWGEADPPSSVDGRILQPSTSWPRHPEEHLSQALDEHSDAASAYRRVCYYLDHESEARERGDLTQDRVERLALGAGLHLKERAWSWITVNV